MWVYQHQAGVMDGWVLYKSGEPGWVGSGETEIPCMGGNVPYSCPGKARSSRVRLMALEGLIIAHQG
jgi:hypothetical protein